MGQQREICLTLPLPGSDMLPNNARRLHWGTASHRRRELRSDATLTLMRQKPKGWRPVSSCDIEIQWFVPRKRYADRDGLLAASKPIIDALQPERSVKDRSGLNVHPGAGIIKDDSDAVINRYILHRPKLDRRNPRTEITIKEVHHGTL